MGRLGRETRGRGGPGIPTPPVRPCEGAPPRQGSDEDGAGHWGREGRAEARGEGGTEAPWT